MGIDNPAFDEPIAVKIAWAEARYREHAPRLRTDSEVAGLLQTLRERVCESHQARVEAGIAEMCATCERDRGSSCCGADLEDRHDGVILLINLLLGATLPGEARGPRDCLFLGENGCRLIVKDVLCVNFLCKSVTETIPPEKIEVMREREGKELETFFSLHACVCSRLSELIDA
jgi:hypothetical protein